MQSFALIAIYKFYWKRFRKWCTFNEEISVCAVIRTCSTIYFVLYVIVNIVVYETGHTKWEKIYSENVCFWSQYTFAFP
jgi:hypothetical protein